MHICDNVGDHLIGNVYARYEMETEAQTAVDSLNNRWYAGESSFARISLHKTNVLTGLLAQVAHSMLNFLQ